MRLDMIDGIHNSIIINDIYNSDINSLEIAIDYLNQKKGNKETVLILSDILQSYNNLDTYKYVKELIQTKKINIFIGIGENLYQNRQLFSDALLYKTTEDFLNQLDFNKFFDKAILIKGARNFEFEKITSKLQAKNHESTIEIDLSLIKQNLEYFKSCLKSNTKIMAMVKAFSYGNGYFEIANLLQFNRIDYLAVAFIDEGIELRERGITTSIMVMNPAIYALKSMLEFKLEPEIYSISILKELIKKLEHAGIKNFSVHIKIDTGMHRLGFVENEMQMLCEIINSTNSIKIASCFSHLAGSDNPKLDYFTEEQITRFSKCYEYICKNTKFKPDRHILNSAGIIRFPQYNFEMVRLGIGLYGLMPEICKKIFPVTVFKSIISQIHKIDKNETVSYSRSGKINRNSVIATVPVGYADGLNRKLGNGNWFFMINNQKAFTIGNICMDMCMVDITDIEANEGDEVIIFGQENSICKMAEILDTIPYEIITGISQRIKRIYSEE